MLFAMQMQTVMVKQISRFVGTQISIIKQSWLSPIFTISVICSSEKLIGIVANQVS
jgi:hypothetical protein